MIRTAVLLCLIAVFGYSPAQQPESTPAYHINASLHYGFIIAHRASMYALQRDHVRMAELSLLKQTSGSRAWHSLYNYPLTGMKYHFFDLGNKNETGLAHSLMPFIVFNGWGQPPVHFQFGFGIGAGYFTRIFNVRDNYRNLAMGSRFSFAVSLSTALEWSVTRHTSVTTGISFYHFSNGAIKTPNLGYNIPSASIGITHKFGHTEMRSFGEKKQVAKVWRRSLCLGAGVKQRYPVNGPNYGVISFSLAGLKQVSHKSAIGAGADVHYDESLHTVLESDDGSKAPVKDAFRAGLCASYELIFSDFSLLFQGGRYFYSKHNSEGKFYQRLGMRYVFYKSWFACLNLRSHFGKADFFEAGTGIKF
jgi:hypothetical protein